VNLEIRCAERVPEEEVPNFRRREPVTLRVWETAEWMEIEGA